MGSRHGGRADTGRTRAAGGCRRPGWWPRRCCFWECFNGCSRGRRFTRRGRNRQRPRVLQALPADRRRWSSGPWRLWPRRRPSSRRAREAAGYPVDASVDPNRTGLIGVEWSSITTTLGDLQAKRTAANPLWAAYVARRMADAGVREGDVVWATFSGSFPGLNLAVMAAAQAMDVRLYAVSSLTASMWGANLPGFTWADMEAAVRGAGLLSHGSVAVTLGGDYDRGPELFAGLAGDPGGGAAALREAASRHSWPLLEPRRFAGGRGDAHPTTLAEAGRRERPSLLINAGGGHASLGDCRDPWPTGLTVGPRACRGVPGLMHVMSADGVPVLHLLNVHALAAATGIPFDGRFHAGSGP